MTETENGQTPVNNLRTSAEIGAFLTQGLFRDRSHAH